MSPTLQQRRGHSPQNLDPVASPFANPVLPPVQTITESDLVSPMHTSQLLPRNLLSELSPSYTRSNPSLVSPIGSPLASTGFGSRFSSRISSGRSSSHDWGYENPLDPLNNPWSSNLSNGLSRSRYASEGGVNIWANSARPSPSGTSPSFPICPINRSLSPEGSVPPARVALSGHVRTSSNATNSSVGSTGPIGERDHNPQNPWLGDAFRHQPIIGSQFVDSPGIVDAKFEWDNSNRYRSH